MRKFLIIGLLVLKISLGYSNAKLALEAYKKQDYTASLNYWNSELKNPNANLAQVFFQIGNCLEKLNDHSQAILFYEKSLKEEYNNGTVKFNLKVSRAKIGLDTENKVLFVNDWIKRLVYFFDPSSYMWIIIVLSWSILIVSIFHRYKPFAGSQKLITCTLTLIALSALFYFGRMKFQSNEDYGIVIAEDAIGYNTVTMKGTGKQIKQGEKVKVIDQVDQNLQILAENDSLFWIKRSDLNRI